MQSPQQEPFLTMYRVEVVEKEVQQIKNHLNTFQTTRENDLKFQQSDLRIKTIVDAFNDIKLELSKLRDEVKAIDIKMVAKEKESSDRDNSLRESVDKLQIRTLVWFVCWFLGIVAAILIGYINHIFP